MPPLDPATRTSLQLVAAHVLGRRRFDVAGRFGLRASPGGFGTPAFGEAPEVVRVTGGALAHEVGPSTTTLSMEGRSLRQLADVVGVELGGEFSTGPDTPKIEDADEPLHFDPPTVGLLAHWYALGWVVMDAFVAGLPEQAEPATIQLWPEHFDAGTNVATPGGRLNIGFSPGDGYQPEPYAYVGPWGPERPGDAQFWNAPFGAVLLASEVIGHADPAGRCRQFLSTGVRLLSEGSRS